MNIMIGKVISRDLINHLAKVRWLESGTESGWLSVLRTSTEWMPAGGDVVAVAFMPVEDGDGIILGVVQ